MDILAALIMAMTQQQYQPGKDERGTDWIAQNDRYKIPRENWSEYQTPDVGKVCAANTGESYNPLQKQFQGCVERTTNFDGSIPYLKMWLPPNPPDWLRQHEERHGDGWWHKRKL